MPTFQEPRNHIRTKTRLALVGVSVSLLALSVSILATSTYAWYKLADLLIVDGIKVGYGEGQTFEIGMKDSTGTIVYPNYTSMDEPQVLTNDTLKQYSSFTGTEKLDPVSGMYASNWLNATADPATTLPQFRSSYYGSKDIHQADLASSANYLQFEFYINSDRDVYVFLAEETSLLANTDANATIAKNKGLSATDLNAVEKCARVSFYSTIGTESAYTIYEPNVSVGSTTVYSGRLNLTDDDRYYDYDSEGKEILFGEYSADHLVYDEAGRVNSLSGKETAFNALSAPSPVQPLDLEKSVSEGGLVRAKETSYPLSTLTAMDYRNGHPLAYCPRNVPTRMVVSVYIEGWDLDTVESIGYGKFNLNLAFAGLYKSLS
jgi:hypothetical protein